MNSVLDLQTQIKNYKGRDVDNSDAKVWSVEMNAIADDVCALQCEFVEKLDGQKTIKRRITPEHITTFVLDDSSRSMLPTSTVDFLAVENSTKTF